MKIFNESDMIRGWFIGNFNPTAFNTKNCEVALKRYKAGDKESEHVHKIATEITLIVHGTIIMNSQEFKKGSIIVLDPEESADFKAVEDTITVVFKSPSIQGDKYDIHCP